MDVASSEPPTKIDPYKTLNIPNKATAAEVKTAYKKLALKHHPDKVAPSHRKTAHTKFQEIAFAYAILSDTARRDRYDTTGSTSESLSDDFNWASYFKAQYAETVTDDKLNSLKATYQGSEEEQRDVLDAYKRHKGSLNKVFRDVMMSNALEDEDRFRGYIDAAIIAEEVQGFDAYVNETKKVRKARKRGAEREKAEAIQHAKDLGLYDSVFGKGKGKPKDGGPKGLANLIQQRQKQRATTFLDDLETKYGGKSAANGKPNGKKRKANDETLAEVSNTNGTRHKRQKAVEVFDESSEEDEEDEAHDEPPEEAFQAMAARTSKASYERQKAVEMFDESSEEDEEDGAHDGPPEEAFQAMAARTSKASYVKAPAEDSDAEESLGDEDTEEEEDDSEEEDEPEKEEAPEEEKPKPANKATRNG